MLSIWLLLVHFGKPNSDNFLLMPVESIKEFISLTPTHGETISSMYSCSIGIKGNDDFVAYFVQLQNLGSRKV
jgi:hypothetical protein